MKSICIFLVVLLIPFIGKSQETEVRGTLMAFNKYPLKNVTVKAKKSKAEVKTDDEGHFIIPVKKNDQLIIEAKTFERFIYRIGATDKPLKINLIYLDKKNNLDVAVDEGYLRKEDLEYGLTNLANENNVYANFTDVYEAIRYAIPAASFINENGVQKVKLRGTQSFNQDGNSSNAALYVVNGFLTEDVNYVMPYTIISIEQLQGPAAGMYGTGSGNGVIAITTK